MHFYFLHRHVCKSSYAQIGRFTNGTLSKIRNAHFISFFFLYIYRYDKRIRNGSAKKIKSPGRSNLIILYYIRAGLAFGIKTMFYLEYAKVIYIAHTL